MNNPTKEQIAVINHPNGNHARILAVAGSGKTSTLVYRIKHLVVDKHENPSSIQVLMFNRLARKQFYDRMKEAEIPVHLQPKVDTFHSFSYGFIEKIKISGKFPGNWDEWIEDKEEKARMCLASVISKLEDVHVIRESTVDMEEAYQAISLWKGSLIPPQFAGYRGNLNIPKVYDSFEKERLKRHAITYDDFIPITVAFLERNDDLLKNYTNIIQHLIVDEYQDVNYGQQRLVELLAGTKADVMVVGDDDQTIYEWRGARPNYIIREFQSIFVNKPIIQYNLSQSFRFGPVIAQCAYNSILFNTNRVQKSLVADEIKKPSSLFVYEQALNQGTDVNKELTDQVVTLVKQKGVEPQKIVVLCRMFAQLSNLESEFLSRKIPYRIEGQKPFFERREIRVLLDYLRLSINYHEPVNEKIKNEFLNIANTPNRMIAKRDLEQLISGSIVNKLSIAKSLQLFTESTSSPLNDNQRERVLELMSALERANKKMQSFTKYSPVEILLELVESINYFAHFDSFYGKGETSFERKESILNFINYSESTKLPIHEFIRHIETLDTTRGAAENQQIVMTTIFRTKGLEFDYVIIPNCTEGYMPCLLASGNSIYDTSGRINEPESSESIENERRLFYVGVTRAKEAVYIGTGSMRGDSSISKPSRFLDEIQYEPTIKVMTALHESAVGKPSGKKNLLSHLSKYGGIKCLTQNLFSHYLISLRDNELLSEVLTILSSSPEIPFRYRFPYSAAQVYENNDKEKISHSMWENIE